METTKRKKILWIDDDYRILKGFLRKVADVGVDVEYAGFALEGYRMLRKPGADYDLILVDIILPLFPMSEISLELPDAIKSWEFSDDLGILIIKEIAQLQPVPKIAVLSILDEITVQRRLGDNKVLRIFPKQTITSAELKENIMQLLEI
jgi:CheY-like chemotaxis protein